MALRDLIKRTLFSKELESFNEGSRQFVMLSKEAELKAKEAEKRGRVVREIFKEFPDASIIGVDENKSHEAYYIVKVEAGRMIDIYLYNERGDNVQKSRIYAEYLTNEKDETYIHIIDCFAEDENVGNGSILLKWLKKEAVRADAKYITGGLASIDKKKFDKLERFYTKNGFEVTINGDCGKIVCNL